MQMINIIVNGHIQVKSQELNTKGMQSSEFQEVNG